MIAIWDKRMSTGNRTIDAEHRLVLDLLNELNVAITVNAPMIVVQGALESLVRAIDRHFARDGLSVVGSPAGGVIGEHAALSVQAHRLLLDWRSGVITTLDRRTLLALGQRWTGHIGRREALVHPDMAEGRELLAG